MSIKISSINFLLMSIKIDISSSKFFHNHQLDYRPTLIIIIINVKSVQLISYLYESKLVLVNQYSFIIIN